jgi:hypothetical protein
MAIAAVTPDKDAIVCEIHVAAPPERVFQALIDPQRGAAKRVRLKLSRWSPSAVAAGSMTARKAS